MGENIRPIIFCEIAKPGSEPLPRPGPAAGVSGDYDSVIDQALRWAESHDLLGESLPWLPVEFAAEFAMGFMGADLRFAEGIHGNGWTVPVVDDLDQAAMRFDPESIWWQKTVEFVRRIRERCGDDIFIGSLTTPATLDALASFRGGPGLLLDLIESPHKIHRALGRVQKAHSDIAAALEELLEYIRFGSLNRHGFWSPGRCNVVNCDFSCMISPAMFEEFVFPYQVQALDDLDGADYHLDGPNAIRHLDAICRHHEKLRTIQWVAGAGNESKDWSDLFRRIDSNGKGIWTGGDCEKAKRTWRECRSRGVVFRLHAESRWQAEDCLAELEEIGRRKHCESTKGKNAR